MRQILEVIDLSFGVNNCLTVEALVEEMELVAVSPHWVPAVCRGSFYLSDEDVIPATDAGLRKMLSERIDNWQPLQSPYR